MPENSGDSRGVSSMGVGPMSDQHRMWIIGLAIAVVIVFVCLVM